MRNWCGHVEYKAERVETPTTLDELQSVVSSNPVVHALGTRHSFNAVADTAGVHVSAAGLPAQVDIDSERSLARVPAGMRYGEVARVLDAAGWAVHNMASLGHISVAGTVATGTHGSGDRNRTLSASVRGMELVTAGGDRVELSPDSDPGTFHGMVVALGALGVVTALDLAIEPAFDMRQYVFDDVSHEALLAGFDEAFASGYSVSFFTTWGPDLMGQIWLKRREDGEGPWRSDTFLDGHAADGPRHPLPGHDAVNCTEQGGTLGRWHERLPHFRLDFTPSSGDELQTEYLIPRDAAVEVLSELPALAPRLHPLLHVSEIRTIAADDLWLSGAYGRDTVGLHFTWKPIDGVDKVLADLDALVADRGGRPHWGKLFDAPAVSVRARYPRFDDFSRLVEQFDPARKFRNAMLDGLLA